MNYAYTTTSNVGFNEEQRTSHFLNRDDLILNLKKKSNLSIREIAEILGINRGIVSGIKV